MKDTRVDRRKDLLSLLGWVVALAVVLIITSQCRPEEDLASIQVTTFYSETETGDLDDDATPPPDLLREPVVGGAPGRLGLDMVIGPDGKPVAAVIKERSLYLYTVADDGIDQELIVRFVDQCHIAVDDAGAVHLVYYDSATDGVIYATDKSGDWEYTPMVNDAEGHTSPDIAVDADGNVHIVYCELHQFSSYVERYPIYVNNVGGVWTREVVDDGQYVTYQFASIAVDEYGKAHLGLIQSSTIYYATNRFGFWTRKKLDESYSLPHGIVIACDRFGRVHLAWSQWWSSNDAHTGYAIRRGWNWEVHHLVDDRHFCASPPTLIVDATGKAHLAGYGKTMSHYRLLYLTYDASPYHWWSSGEWTFLPLLKTRYDVEYTALAINDAGRILLAFHDASTGELKMYVDPSSTSKPFVLDDTGQYEDHFSLDVDSLGRPHVAVYDPLSTSLLYARRIDGAWQVETVDAGGEVGKNCHLVLDSDDLAHIVYYDAGNDQLKLAENDADGWSLSMLPFPAEIARLAVDSLNNLHVSYHNELDEGIYYANNIGGDWTSTLVLDDQNDAKLALDADDAAHLLYEENGSIYEISNASGSWATSLIWQVNPDYDYLSPVISLSPAGQLMRNAKYRHCEHGSCWTYLQQGGTFVGSYGDGHDIDGDFIVYYTELGHDLMTKHLGDGAEIPLDTFGYVGSKCDMRLDDDGNVHIIYSGEGALWYATFSDYGEAETE